MQNLLPTVLEKARGKKGTKTSSAPQRTDHTVNELEGAKEF